MHSDSAIIEGEGAEHREHADDEHPRVRAELPRLNCEPTHPTKRARSRAAVHARVRRSSPASTPRQSRPRDIADDRLARSRRRRSRRRSTCRRARARSPLPAATALFGTSAAGLSRVHAIAMPATAISTASADERRTRVPCDISARAAGDARRRLADHRLEPVSSAPTGPRKRELRNVEPAADDAEHAEHDERAGHDPRRLAQMRRAPSRRCGSGRGRCRASCASCRPPS